MADLEFQDDRKNLIESESESTEIDLSGSIEAPVHKIEYFTLGQRIKSLNFPGGIQLKELFFKSREGLKPWAEFSNAQKFSVPKTVAEGGSRLVRNVDRFRSNYLYVCLAVSVFCLLTSPLLLIALCASLGACYTIKVKNANKKIVVMGRELSKAQQYAAVGMLSFPVFWLAGAGSAVFWIIGASVVVIVLHALFHNVAEDNGVFDLQMEEVA